MTREPRVRIGVGATVGVLLVASVALGGTEALPGPWLEIVGEISGVLDRAVRAYEAKDLRGAQDLAADAYFGPFEERGMEAAVRREISVRRARELERMFGGLRQAMTRGEPALRVRQQIAALREALDQDARELVRAGATATPLAEKEESVGPEADAVPRALAAQALTTQISARLEQASERHRAGDREGAKALLMSAYFDLFEGQGLEAAVAARAPRRKAEIEAGFVHLRGLIVAGEPADTVAEAVEALKGRIHQAAALLDQNRGHWGAFLNGLILIVREGFEAILIVTALAAYLLKSGHRGRVGVVYRASAVALVASVLTAIAIRTLFTVSPRHQETLEGAAMLLATAVLFYVSYWLTSKAEADRWQRYVRTKVQAALGAGSLVTLWSAAFLAVYREGAETVLFYEALLAGSGPGEGGAVLAGLGVGSLVLVLMFLLLRSGALRIPIGPFFTVTSVLLYYLAFVFAGRGIRELQESGLVGITPASGIPTWDFLGLYPTWESVGLQAVLVGAAIVAVGHLFRRRGRLASAETVHP
ncbi:MAG: FTR1 family iron permease [Candidatus Rokubacteria bacterium]|nr:FTR1 family iron permease [Candidatus Rokubacteria bacterium]